MSLAPLSPDDYPRVAEFVGRQLPGSAAAGAEPVVRQACGRDDGTQFGLAVRDDEGLLAVLLANHYPPETPLDSTLSGPTPLQMDGWFLVVQSLVGHPDRASAAAESALLADLVETAGPTDVESLFAEVPLRPAGRNARPVFAEHGFERRTEHDSTTAAGTGPGGLSTRRRCPEHGEPYGHCACRMCVYERPV
jgi:hypothetical protein